jgi:hypothetical protein
MAWFSNFSIIDFSQLKSLGEALEELPFFLSHLDISRYTI